jgi:UDP-glucose 4-epimerase
MKVVVPGASGKLGRLVTAELVERGHQVVGIDRRPWVDPPEGVQVFELDIRKRAVEDLFRKHRPDAVIHMATVTHLREQSDERYRVNLEGTRAVVEHCATFGVKNVVFVGRHTYYGATPEAPLYHTEDEPPTGTTPFPELADLVAADLYAGSALWRHPEIRTAILRVCYSLGPSLHGTLATYLRGPRVPTVLGYDPLFQFMHEVDVASAIVLAFEKQIRGVFNVAGPPPLPLSVIIREAGREAVPLPELLFRLTLGRFGLPRLSTGALAHIKYPIVVDANRFLQVTGFRHAYSESETIAAFREAAPLR